MDEADFARADLVGHSLGASVALLVAARHPDRVRSVVAAAHVLFQEAFLLATLDHWDALARSNLSDHDLNLAVALGAFGRDAFERLVPAVLADLDAHPLRPRRAPVWRRSSERAIRSSSRRPPPSTGWSRPS